MLVFVAGDAHGRLERLYADVLAFEQHLGCIASHVLHVGDFGVWPDAAKIDRATREHDGAGDFPRWFAERRAVPRATTFIQGNHEDFAWLLQAPSEILPGLHFLPNGEVTTLSEATASRRAALRVGGVGGCFGPSDYDRKGTSLRGAARRHYAHDELELLASHVPLDVVLFHDAPKDAVFEKRMRSGDIRRYASKAEGLSEALARIQPKFCFFGHHHARVDAVVAGVPCVGLNAVGYPGSLVAIETYDTELAIVGEWPRRA